MGEIEVNYGSILPTESLKVIAESVGIGNLSDDAAKEISDSATYRLKLVLQVSTYSNNFNWVNFIATQGKRAHLESKI